MDLLGLLRVRQCVSDGYCQQEEGAISFLMAPRFLAITTMDRSILGFVGVRRERMIVIRCVARDAIQNPSSYDCCAPRGDSVFRRNKGNGAYHQLNGGFCELIGHDVLVSLCSPPDRLPVALRETPYGTERG
jgi:hypothetical protein